MYTVYLKGGRFEMKVQDPGNLLIPFDKVKELVHDKLVKTLDLKADVNSDVLRTLELFFLELEMQLYVDDIWDPDWRLDYLEGVIDFVEEAKLVTKKQAQWLRQYHDWIIGNDDMFGDVEDYRKALGIKTPIRYLEKEEDAE